jgi:hypothetical protein
MAGRHLDLKACCWRSALGTAIKSARCTEDAEKEREVLAVAVDFRDPHRALEFLTTWPDVRRAAALVRRRFGAIDGNCYWVPGLAAERLEAKEPLAATLLYRRMIDFTLDRAKSSRYGMLPGIWPAALARRDHCRLA